VGRPEKFRLGETLVQQKLISQEQLKIGLDEQRRSGRKLGRILVENGFVTEDQICEGLARQFNIPYVNLKFFNIPPDVARKLPETHARRHRAIALEERKSGYLVGLSDPSDLFAYDEIARVLKRDIDLAVVNWIASIAAPTRSRVSRVSWNKTSAMPRSISAHSARRPASRKRRSSGCCKRSSKMRRRSTRRTFTLSRRNGVSMSDSASTAS
jgi:hypothetical protein